MTALNLPTLWTPPRSRLKPWWRLPRVRAITEWFAGNKVQVGSDNKVRVKSNGVVVAGDSDPCCCAGYVQYKTCSDNSLVDLWRPTNDAPTILRYGYTCYQKSTTTSATPGTIATGYDTASSCADPACSPPSGSPCGQCYGITPRSYTVTLSGIVICSGCYTIAYDPLNRYLCSYWSGVSINGTYTLTQSAFDACDYLFTGSGPSYTVYSNAPSPCTTDIWTTVQGPFSDMYLHLYLLSGAMNLVVVIGAFGGTSGGAYAFNSSTSLSGNCIAPRTLTNSLSGCIQTQNKNQAGGGGTAYITPGS